MNKIQFTSDILLQLFLLLVVQSALRMGGHKGQLSQLTENSIPNRGSTSHKASYTFFYQNNLVESQEQINNKAETEAFS